MKARGARRFREQKWLLDSVVSTIGLDWDLLRMATVTAPIGFEGMGDWAVVAGKAKRFDDISPSFEEVAAGREARAREAEQLGNEVTARESYLVASIYYGVAQWPIDEINDRNLALNAKKLDCYARYAACAHHKIERIDIPMGKHILPAWLHLPVAGKPPYPLVIMLPGMDTFKEKLVWAYGDKMLERGFAALAIDGPGQSEPLMHGLKVTADNFADAGRACIAWIDTRKDLDQNRIGVFGRSFGSYAATVLSNAIAERLCGVVVGLPCFEPGFAKIFEEASPTYKNHSRGAVEGEYSRSQWPDQIRKGRSAGPGKRAEHAERLSGEDRQRKGDRSEDLVGIVDGVTFITSVSMRPVAAS